MKIFRSIRTAALLACAVVLAACSTLQIEKPQSAEDSLQYAKATLAAAYRTLGDGLAANTITQDRGNAAFAKLGAVKKDLALAEKSIAAGKPTDALSTINLALAALVTIRGELAAKQTSAIDVRDPYLVGAAST